MIELLLSKGERNAVSCYLNSTDHFIEPEQNQLASNPPTSRREFLTGATLAVRGLSRPVSVAADFSETTTTQRTPRLNDLQRTPDSEKVQIANADPGLLRTGGGTMTD